MAGYSGTPLPAKLGIKAAALVLLLGAPDEFEQSLLPLPANVTISAERRRGADVILSFTRARAQLEAEFSDLAAHLQPAGGLWIAWPKKSSGMATDLHENLIRDIGLAAGLVDNKVCAVTEVWSGLRFVYRLKDRPKPAPR